MLFLWGRETPAHVTLFLSPDKQKITTYAFSQSQLHLNKISITHISTSNENYIFFLHSAIMKVVSIS